MRQPCAVSRFEAACELFAQCSDVGGRKLTGREQPWLQGFASVVKQSSVAATSRDRTSQRVVLNRGRALQGGKKSRGVSNTSAESAAERDHVDRMSVARRR